MIETLISSKTRIKLLLKFFLNRESISYLRGLEAEFQESTNAIRQELNRFEKAGMLTSFIEGNKKFFKANIDHPLHKDIHNILLKYIGFDTIVDKVIDKLGDIEQVYILGSFAKGLDADHIELVFVGNVYLDYLSYLIDKSQKHISRKINYTVLKPEEVGTQAWLVNSQESILLWSNT